MKSSEKMSIIMKHLSAKLAFYSAMVNLLKDSVIFPQCLTAIHNKK